MVNGGSGAGTTITKTGTGSLYLAGNNQSYAGNWNIAGNVYTTFSNAFGSGNVSFSNTVWYVGWTSASYTYANNITFTNNMFVGGSATGATITLTGMLTGSGNLFFNDNGGGATGSTTILAGTNNITSGVFQIDNTVQLNTSGYLAGVTSVNLTRWGTSSTGRAFNWNVAETVAASTTFNFGNLLSGQNQLGMLASGTTTINGVCNLNSSGSAGSDLQISAVSGGTLVLAGQVSDSLWAANARAVNKIGAGTAVLSANTNNYRGGTTVSVGTLLVDNASGSGTGTGSVSVSGGGATLGGTGIIAPTGTNGIAVASGGFIEPGSNGIGTLTINLGGTTGTVSMASGSGFKFELGTANVSIGTIAAGSSDRLAVSGATAGDFTFNLNNVDFSNTGSAGYYKLFSTDLNLATTWIGLTYDASTGVVSSGLTYSGLAAGLTGGSFIVGTGSGGGFNGGTIGDIYFYSTITPEPSTWVLLTFSLAALAVFRHRLQTIDKK